jgi:PHD/YefM family antitoxin component YafN of YafNO toxin-antitoxin module
MKMYTATQAKKNLDEIMDYVCKSHYPVFVKYKHTTKVILSREDY